MTTNEFLNELYTDGFKLYVFGNGDYTTVGVGYMLMNNSSFSTKSLDDYAIGNILLFEFGENKGVIFRNTGECEILFDINDTIYEYEDFIVCHIRNTRKFKIVTQNGYKNLNYIVDKIC